METKEIIKKEGFLLPILNGMALGIVILLIPSAFFSELFRYLASTYPVFQLLSGALSMTTSLMGFFVGILIGMNFKLNPIQFSAMGLAVMFAGGAVQFKENTLILSGTGDVINMGITAFLAILLISMIGDRLKSYTMLVVPALTLFVAGGIGRFLLPYVKQITTVIGLGVEQLLQLQPFFMSILIAIVFAILIMSPISSVAIALAIQLSGLGSGAANMGITACGVVFAIMGWRINGPGIAMAHFIGSPKISMPLVAMKPQIMLPALFSAAFSGIGAYLFGITGTPMSAGFGASGLIGPIAHLNTVSGGWSLSNILTVTFVYLIFPIVFGLLGCWLFTKKYPIVSTEDYKLELSQ